MKQERDHINIKGLTLVSPEYARTWGLVVQNPVFISPTDSVDMRPPIYQVELTTKVSIFDQTDTETIARIKEFVLHGISVEYRPQSGMGYFETPLLTERVTPDDIAWFASGWGLGRWVAVIEPLGRVKEENDPLKYFNKSTDELKVQKIMAFCRGCSTQLQENGLAVDIGNRGRFYPVCGLAMHGEEIASKQWQYFRFSFHQDGKIIPS
ncbi:MAG: hypothetical protein G01um10147_866 [Microgenomates group bacterium Gr01-1014_7]|nr:MAG: hypothetical protein G01um10147_866 [Microgenomates group bacterium Gr01-1014_7]